MYERTRVLSNVSKIESKLYNDSLLWLATGFLFNSRHHRQPTTATWKLIHNEIASTYTPIIDLFGEKNFSGRCPPLRITLSPQVPGRLAIVTRNPAFWPSVKSFRFSLATSILHENPPPPRTHRSASQKLTMRSHRCNVSEYDDPTVGRVHENFHYYSVNNLYE